MDSAVAREFQLHERRSSGVRGPRDFRPFNLDDELCSAQTEAQVGALHPLRISAVRPIIGSESLSFVHSSPPPLPPPPPEGEPPAGWHHASFHGIKHLPNVQVWISHTNWGIDGLHRFTELLSTLDAAQSLATEAEERRSYQARVGVIGAVIKLTDEFVWSVVDRPHELMPVVDVTRSEAEEIVQRISAQYRLERVPAFKDVSLAAADAAARLAERTTQQRGELKAVRVEILGRASAFARANNLEDALTAVRRVCADELKAAHVDYVEIDFDHDRDEDDYASFRCTVFTNAPTHQVLQIEEALYERLYEVLAPEARLLFSFVYRPSPA